MIKIYFDNVFSDDDNYMSFSYNKKMFDDEFFLGSVASVQADLKIPKSALPSSLDEVKVTIDDEPYLSLVVDEITDEDDDTIDIKLTDRLINTDSPYNFEELVPISAKDLLIAICEEFDIPHDTFNFTNDDVVIDSYDSTITAREYLSMIAELAGGYIRINNEGKLEICTYIDNRNLFKDSENFTIWSKGGTIDNEIYKDTGKSIKTTNAWLGPYINLKDLADDNKIHVGDVITVSQYFRTNFVPTKNMQFTLYRPFGSNTSGGAVIIDKNVVQPNTWYRIEKTFTATSGSLTSTNCRFEADYYDTSDPYYFGNNRENAIWFAKPQVELNDHATPYQPGISSITTSNIMEINSEDVDTYKISENITIERISYEFAGEDYSYPRDTDDSLYTIQLNPDNVFLQVATDEQKDALAQNIIGFTFSNIKIDTCNKFDNNNMLFTFKDINNDSYTCLNQYEADYAGAFVGGYESNIHNAKQDFTKTVSQEAKIKRIRQIINQDENYMKLIAESVDKTELTISDQGVMIDVLANHSNIDVSYDSDGKPISGELTEVTTTNKKFKLDSTGFNIDGDEGYKAKYTETGTYYYDGDNPVGQYTKDGSKQKDLALFGTYMYGMNDINDTPMFVGQLYEDDNNEEAFGHFFNRGD